MFRKQELDAYQKIAAPDELYAKIMDVSTQPRRGTHRYMLRLAGAIAACLVLFVTVGFWPTGHAPGIILNGEKLETSLSFYNSIPAAYTRELPVLSLPLELDIQSTTEVTVSHGCLLPDDGVPTERLTLDRPAELCWEIPQTSDTAACEMKLSDENGVTRITLTYDHAANSITATKTVE